MTSSAPSTGNGDNGSTSATGRYVVVLSDEVHGDESAVADVLSSVAGATNLARTGDFESSALDVRQAELADAAVFSELGVAVVAAGPDRAESLRAAGADDGRVLAVEPERVMHAIDRQEAMPVDYLRGYRDAAEHLFARAFAQGPLRAEAEPAAEFVDTPSATWGLHATGVVSAPQNGQGVRVAVLDTGFDLRHPDFAGRPITAHSFVPSQAVQDGHGHGTHCTGTACGPERPAGSRRYGVASGSDVLVGKVLSDQGMGTDTQILAGISWAVANRCRVVSLSLGADIRTVSPLYETAGRRALEAGTLIVAAAGNNARRGAGEPGFVGVPANSPSIMAVGAVDARLRITDFSARSNPVLGGQVDIAAPGVSVYSSWPVPRRYHTISGTSMATPHVAGIAAQWSQRTGAIGAELWAVLVRAAQRLDIPSLDVGAGLVQAPGR